jgi:DUF1680 family protein
MGLVKLYRVTGDERYLNLAKFMLDSRKGGPYNQSDIPVVDQTFAEGRAVRATYMYSGMADVAAILHAAGGRCQRGEINPWRIQSKTARLANHAPPWSVK